MSCKKAFHVAGKFLQDFVLSINLLSVISLQDAWVFMSFIHFVCMHECNVQVFPAKSTRECSEYVGSLMYPSVLYLAC